MATWDAAGIAQGHLHYFRSSASDVKSFRLFFTAGQISLIFSLDPPVPLFFMVSMLCFHYFFSVTMPGGCRSQLSWIPSLLLGSTHYPIRHHCPSSSTVDEFTCKLQVKTQLFSEVVQPNAPFRNKQFHHSLS